MCLATAKYLKSIFNNIHLSAIAYRESIGEYALRNSNIRFEKTTSETKILKSDQTIEKEYIHYIQNKILGDIPFGNIIANDRYLLNDVSGFLYNKQYAGKDERRYDIIGSRFKHIEEVIENINPNLIIYTGYDKGPSTALVTKILAEYYDIPTLIPHSIRLDKRIFISNSIVPSTISGMGENMNNVKIRKKKRKSNCSGTGVDNIIDIGELVNKAYRFIRAKKMGDVYCKGLIKPYVDRARLRYRSHRLTTLCADKSDIPKKFIFFPLHVEPEESLLLRAQNYRNQKAVVEAVGQNLKYPYRLVVKEHPASVLKGHRATSYYKELKNIPNVLMVPSDIESRELIRKSAATITISGTAALEAALLDTPSAVFGTVYFEGYFDSITRLTSFDQIGDYINTLPTPNVDNSTQKQKFFREVKRNSVSVDITSLNNNNKPGDILRSREYQRFVKMLRIHMDETIGSK
ncbi:hypothetical protein [Salinibacter ruber]|uniref:capsular polysaccharide export protein, LipB/KpsS family n=1 Tax=Salinibacter ruber TaxID=146919 RepID=UPI0021679492